MSQKKIDIRLFISLNEETITPQALGSLAALHSLLLFYKPSVHTLFYARIPHPSLGRDNKARRFQGWSRELATPQLLVCLSRKNLTGAWCQWPSSDRGSTEGPVLFRSDSLTCAQVFFFVERQAFELHSPVGK